MTETSHILKFEQWEELFENYHWHRDDFQNSSFMKFPEFILKRRSGDRNKGELNDAGRMTDFIFRNQGLTAKQILQQVLNMPGKSQKEMYYRGGQALDGVMSAALSSGYVIRNKETPMKWYARLDKTTTIPEIEQKTPGTNSWKSIRTMKRIKDFKDWLAEGYYDPPEDPDPWMVQYEDLLVELEDKMEKEGMKAKNLWEDLMEAAEIEEKKRREEGKHFVATPGPDDQFSDDLDKFMGDKYHEMYTGKYNAEWDAEEATPEYTKVSKKAEKDFTKKNPQPSPSTGKGRTSWSDWSRKKSHYVEKELYRNVAEKNWNEYKNIYKKWQDYLHKIRGSLQGTKFGL